jgi:hypothetical protein
MVYHIGSAFTPQNLPQPSIVEGHPPPPSDNLTAATADLGGVKSEPGHGIFGDGGEKVRRMKVSTAQGAGAQRNEEFGKGLKVISDDNVVHTPTSTWVRLRSCVPASAGFPPTLTDLARHFCSRRRCLTQRTRAEGTDGRRGGGRTLMLWVRFVYSISLRGLVGMIAHQAILASRIVRSRSPPEVYPQGKIRKARQDTSCITKAKSHRCTELDNGSEARRARLRYRRKFL